MISTSGRYPNSLITVGGRCHLSWAAIPVVRPAQSLPRIISSGDYPASIAAIRSYFTDEQVIRAIAGYVGIDFDTLIAGDYKIVVEPIAYFVYGGAYYAMTATEAALYDQKVNGDLRS